MNDVLSAQGFVEVPLALPPHRASALLEHVRMLAEEHQLAARQWQCEQELHALLPQLATSDLTRVVKQCGAVSAEHALPFLIAEGVPIPATLGQRLVALRTGGSMPGGDLEYECEHCGDFRADWDVVSAHEAACVRNPAMERMLAAQQGIGQVHGRVCGSQVVRWDIKLELNSVVSAALDSILKSIAPVVRESLGPGARMVELSALVSEVGAEDQPVHSDTAWTPQPEVLTCFVALQPIEHQMGPTVMLPCTHDSPEHLERAIQLGEARAALIRDPAYARAVLGTPAAIPCVGGCGTAWLMDSRLLHCGSANMARQRTLFYLSFRRASLLEGLTARCDVECPVSTTKAARLEDLDLGSTMSLQPQYQDRFTLEDLISFVGDAVRSETLDCDLTE